MITLREEQQELETAIKAADNLTRNQFNELGRKCRELRKLARAKMKEVWG